MTKLKTLLEALGVHPDHSTADEIKAACQLIVAVQGMDSDALRCLHNICQYYAATESGWRACKLISAMGDGK